MQVIGVRVSPDEIFNRSSYWTMNRVFNRNNPNYSQESNEAYAMEEDDKKYFFEEHYLLACARFSLFTLALRKKLILTNSSGILPSAFVNSFLTDNTTFYFRVSDAFSEDVFIPLINEYLKLHILRDWYRLKNIIEEVDVINFEIEGLEQKIKTTIFILGQDKDANLSYNNGFNTSTNISDEIGIDEVIDVGNVRVFTSEYTQEFS